MNKAKEEVSIWDVDPVSTMLQRIHFQYTTKKLRSLSVLSEKRAEGKTTISILLARGLCEIYGFKVLLVDFNSEGDSLLSKYLSNYETKDGFVLNSQFPFSIFRIKDLDVDWSKQSFDGPYLNRLITGFTSQYDLIIVDTDSSTLRVNTDSNLIISSESKNKNNLEKLTLEMELNRKHLLGVVFNI